MGPAEWQHWHPADKLLGAPVTWQIGFETQTKCPGKIKRVASKYGKVNTSSTIPLPKLVGTKCPADVNIEGNNANCLLDTGSQVTTISFAFFVTCLMTV